MPSAALLEQLLSNLSQWTREAGFDAFGISDLDLEAERAAYCNWLERNHHGDMQWLGENIDKRFDPASLVPGTLRVISLRMNYFPSARNAVENLKGGDRAYVSRYALGRDYHKLIRKRLAKIADKLAQEALRLNINPHASGRAFVDSAPVLERPLARKAGLGWVGKHTLLLDKAAGSWFFLGEILTSLPLPITALEQDNACGECEACLKICPTDAFTAPYVLDARRCISYLTIEHQGTIPLELREAIGNRIFGCDDCQLICPWNKYAQFSAEMDFQPRHQLDMCTLLDLFSWDEASFLKNTEGSAIRRAGYRNWRRNLAVALGNAPQDLRILAELQAAAANPATDELVREHLLWAIERQQSDRRRRRKARRDR